jgi:hypothetical protein
MNCISVIHTNTCPLFCFNLKGQVNLIYKQLLDSFYLIQLGAKAHREKYQMLGQVLLFFGSTVFVIIAGRYKASHYRGFVK